MNANADTLRVVLALYHFEAWPPKRIARVLRIRPQEVLNFLNVLREFQILPPTREFRGAAEPSLQTWRRDDFF